MIAKLIKLECITNMHVGNGEVNYNMKHPKKFTSFLGCFAYCPFRIDSCSLICMYFCGVKMRIKEALSNVTILHLKYIMYIREKDL